MSAPDSPGPLAPPVASGLLLSIQVGRPRDMLIHNHPDDRPIHWTSGIFKSPIAGAVRITSDGIEGDAQADLENHGGPDNVVLVYDADHYPIWRDRLGMPELAPGHFGENFTVSGFSDDTVCIGDIWEVGTDLTLQITQARQPCYKLARRLRCLDIVRLVRENSWGGWYLRVLQAGTASPGMSVVCTHRPHPQWSAARAVQTMYRRRQDPGPARELATLPELSARWKEELLET